MDVGLAVAGSICLVMAVGHTAIGVIWVLPSLTEEKVPRTPFGPASMSVSMIRVTWYVVTVFLITLGGLLLMLAWDAGEPRTLLLRWFAVAWFAATAMALSIALRSMRSVRGLLRLPVPFLWIVLGVLLWRASG